MRVIAGTKKGMKLEAPEGDDITRPTSDRAKEALFGSMQFELRDAIVLDLFAGSGAIGIEALSRGASFVCFADADKKAIDCIKKNLNDTKFMPFAEVVFADFEEALKRFAQEARKFDFVFIDPPYQSGYYNRVLVLLKEYDLIKPGAKVVLEHKADVKMTVPDGFETLKIKKYGKAHLTYLRREQ